MDKLKGLNGAVKATVMVALTLVLTGALVLLAAEKSESAFLGVAVQRLDDEARDKAGASHGVRVMDVEKESAAALAGIRKGDVIQALNGEKVRDPQTLAEIIGELAPGGTARIGLRREGKALEVKAVLGKHVPREHFRWRSAPMPRILRSQAYLGVNLLELNPDLAVYFSVKDGEGVLVSEVANATPAEKAGLKAGDVIVQMNDKAIKESADIHKALATLNKGESVDITVVRHGKRTTLKAQPDFNRRERVIRFHGKGGDIGIEHLELPEIDIEVPEFDIELPGIPEAPVSEEIAAHVHESLDHAQEKLASAREKLGQAKVKIEKRLKYISGNYWL